MQRAVPKRKVASVKSFPNLTRLHGGSDAIGLRPTRHSAAGANLPQPRSAEIPGSGGRAADRQSRACLSAASLRGGPGIEHCRWLPEGPAAVERKTRCGGSGVRQSRHVGLRRYKLRRYKFRSELRIFHIGYSPIRQAFQHLRAI